MFLSRIMRTAVAVLLLAAASLSTAHADPGRTLVFAAASLTDVLTAIGKSYEAETGGKVVFSFAASSVLARQIEAAPAADLFISADEEWMNYLTKRGLIRSDSRVDLLGNELVLAAPAASTLTLAITHGFPLLEALNGGRLAIGDPQSVPAGKYARSALTSLGVWDALADHLAQAENVRVALAYVARGETPLGVVYKTDALAQKKVRIVGVFPRDSHPPIVYPAALTKTAGPDAATFLAFLGGAEARAIFVRAGFNSLAQGR